MQWNPSIVEKIAPRAGLEPGTARSFFCYMIKKANNCFCRTIIRPVSFIVNQYFFIKYTRRLPKDNQRYRERKPLLKSVSSHRE